MVSEFFERVPWDNIAHFRVLQFRYFHAWGNHTVDFFRRQWRSLFFNGWFTFGISIQAQWK